VPKVPASVSNDEVKDGRSRSRQRRRYKKWTAGQTVMKGARGLRAPSLDREDDSGARGRRAPSLDREDDSEDSDDSDDEKTGKK
jgi:hypothetical protein